MRACNRVAQNMCRSVRINRQIGAFLGDRLATFGLGPSGVSLDDSL
jgi:hypothetical protein